MKLTEILQLLVYFGSLIVLTPLLGSYMFRVFTGERHILSFLSPVERFLYRLSFINPNQEMTWKKYLASLLVFNLIGVLVVLCLQLFQSMLPLNPQQFTSVSFWLAFNTAVSFVTNTNWQSYSGEATLSYAVQMLGFTVQNFLSAVTGMAVFIALVRGLARRKMNTIGNFWVDITRMTLYVLLPLSIILALLLAGQGVVQTIQPYVQASTLEGSQQVIPLGPAASQIAIKFLGTNGGGFFGVNSCHPFENPTPFTNYLEILSMMLIPAAATFTFGRMIKDARHGWCLFITMSLIFLVSLSIAWYNEQTLNPISNSHEWMEGKETRFGEFNSVYFATATTTVSCGGVNAIHSSFSPLTGMMMMINMMSGEVVFGGVGAGMYSILLFVILTVFVAGLMVGRTPEYLGKKIESREMIWVIVGILISSFAILIGTAFACVMPTALSSLGNSGPHGLSEMLYAYTSCANNNGSAFAGLNTNTDYYDITLAIAMLIGRFGVIIPALAIAGSLAKKKFVSSNSGTFPTNNATFVFTLIAVIIIVGALTFFSVLTLGPLAEHLLMINGRVF